MSQGWRRQLGQQVKKMKIHELLEDDYRGVHRAPTSDVSNASLDDLEEVFPDIYTPNGLRYYGTGEPYDRKTISLMHRARGKPDASITVYRAVPVGVENDKLNKGDWVAITKEYAKFHGDSWVDDGEYKIIEQKVKVGHIYSDGNSIHEYGYDPVMKSNVEEDLRAWFGKGKKGGAGGGGWDRYNTKGERIGKCGDAKPSEGKPKCLSKSKAAKLRAKGGKKAIANAVKRKKKADPNQDRSGKPIRVNTMPKK